MLYPMFAYVAFIFLFICYNFYLRFQSVRGRKVSMGYYRLYDPKNAEIPIAIIAGAKHLANMFETPVLFYVVSILAIVLQQETTVMIGLAWCYVVSRGVHAFVHTTYNNVFHRLIIFWVSIFLLMSMWVSLAMSV
ncbi:MAPEG family protein [Teredinibacter purpureus]|jgi:Uncharacterized protein conserved in bacteria|uniref:MAPEG family protein n=1 Tax=Teredinibacter purpureus TaxID=2731756 RepID=UPI0005F7DBDF|nr:MAPEG family protein [Teredinibacter purpureus]